MGRKSKKRPIDTTAVERLNKDLGVTKLAFTCHKCGANLILDPDHIQSFCQFCGATLPKAEDLIKLSYDYMEKNKDRDLELRKLKHEERKTAARVFHQRTQDIMGIVAFSMIMLWLLILIIVVVFR